VIELLKVAERLQSFLLEQDLPFCFIDGLAVQRWSELRMTRDVHLSVFVGFGREEEFCQGLLGRYEPRLADPVPFALANRVLLLRDADKIGIDIGL
jgi:hypothetical protein